MKINKVSVKFIVLGLSIIFCIGAMSLDLQNNQEIMAVNPADMGLSQYSDKNINQTAVATNLKFKDIAFGKTWANPLPFSNQFATAVRAFKSLLKSPSEAEKKEYGTWVWTPIMQMTPKYMEEIISGAKADNVNVIYLSIDSYLDIFTMEKGPERNKENNIFSKKLDDFIALANKNGITVDAEAGWRNWAENDNTYKAFAIVDYVQNFNDTHTNKFRGFQYDVEPYLLDSYKENKTGVLKNFVKLVDDTKKFLSQSDLRLSVVVPDFYDERDGSPKFTYGGSRQSAFKHLIGILDGKPGNSIIIMSYRNFAEGKEGSIDVSKNEMRTANCKSCGVKIIIAQETGDVLPPYITFHGTSKNYLLMQIEKINLAFDDHSNFGGIAIHYANAFLSLK